MSVSNLYLNFYLYMRLKNDYKNMSLHFELVWLLASNAKSWFSIPEGTYKLTLAIVEVYTGHAWCHKFY